MKLRVACKVLARTWFRNIDGTRVPHYSERTFVRAMARWLKAWPDENTPRRLPHGSRKV